MAEELAMHLSQDRREKNEKEGTVEENSWNFEDGEKKIPVFLIALFPIS